MSVAGWAWIRPTTSGANCKEAIFNMADGSTPGRNGMDIQCHRGKMRFTDFLVPCIGESTVIPGNIGARPAHIEA